MTVQILGDLIADLGMRLSDFPVRAEDIHRLSYMDMGPGGACNVAIMAARFGLQVGCIGEVGDDGFGQLVRAGLEREGVGTAHLQVTPGARTPVAGVIVDHSGEPAYLGYRGNLHIRHWPAAWDTPVKQAEALFADGWAENRDVPAMVLQGFRLARTAGVPVYFDPGPGNPEVDSAWIQEAVALSRVLLLNRSEAISLVGDLKDTRLVSTLLAMGPEWVVLKRGSEGLILAHGKEQIDAPGFSVEVKDTTGAGDSVTGAIMYGILKGLALEKLAVLAAATGAAKVMKLGTGHNLPTLAEIASVLKSNGMEAAEYLPAIER